jgi:phosphatidate cytidylyltransferase
MAEAAKTSDLGVRTLSAIVMVAVAGIALWFGGWVFTAFVVAVGAGVIWEWWGLASKIAKTPLGAALWLVAGVSYVGVAIATLIELRGTGGSAWLTVIVIGTVIATDIGAYAAGRSIGGPKIAPAISPSKTWAGLGGGILAATLWLLAANVWTAADIAQLGSAADRDSGLGPSWPTLAINALVSGTSAAVIAQAGDFFESWMKRRAGVKDSGHLIPGHGGLFDRVDGLLALLLLYALLHLLWWS